MFFGKQIFNAVLIRVHGSVFLSVTFVVLVSVPVTGKNLLRFPLPLLLSFQFPINNLTDTRKVICVLKRLG